MHFIAYFNLKEIIYFIKKKCWFILKSKLVLNCNNKIKQLGFKIGLTRITWFKMLVLFSALQL